MLSNKKDGRNSLDFQKLRSIDRCFHTEKYYVRVMGNGYVRMNRLSYGGDAPSTSSTS